MTQQKSTQTICLISTLFAEDSLVKLFHSLDKGQVSTMQGEHFSLRLLESQPLKDLHIFSLKTFPVCCRTTTAKRLQPSSARFLSWGTMSAGKCLTARISVFPNPGRECILSDILETNVPDKYYTSQSQMEKILSKAYPENKAKGSTEQTDSPAP